MMKSGRIDTESSVNRHSRLSMMASVAMTETTFDVNVTNELVTAC